MHSVCETARGFVVTSSHRMHGLYPHPCASQARSGPIFLAFICCPLVTKQLTITDVEPLLLLGFNDVNLRKIESAFPQAGITARGNRIIVQGEPDDVRTIRRIINELAQVLKRNGELTEADVSTVMALYLQGDGAPTATSDVGDVILLTPGGAPIKSKTPNQARLVEIASAHDVVFAIGPAGTGKTYTAVALAVAALKARKVKRIVLSRPAVEAGEQLGFLPGDFRDKVDPYLRPLYDALGDMLPRERLAEYMEQQVVEIVPLAYMRGRTLSSSFVILDEAQNATRQQMKMFLTRLGINSRAIVTGDATQIDLPSRRNSGLLEARRILQGVEGIAFVEFDRGDVVRHQLVKDIIAAYERDDEARAGNPPRKKDARRA